MRLEGWFAASCHVPTNERHAPRKGEVCVALGSNIGDRLRFIQRGVEFLGSLHSGTESIRLSSLYESEPVQCPLGSGAFYNAVAIIHHSGSPYDLLKRLKDFEERQGRNIHAERNAPRPLDLDIIYYGDFSVSEPVLTLPHPRATLRKFVLLPLAELRPYLVLPGQEMTVVQLLGMLSSGERLRRVASQPR